MIRYLAIFIILFSANMAGSFAPGDIEWAPGISGTLTAGGTLINGEYMVKAVQFPHGVPGMKDLQGNIVPETAIDPSVLIEIYRNGIILNTLLMTPNSDPYIDPDYEVKVTATDFPANNSKDWIYDYYDPWVSLTIQKRGEPELDVSVTTDKSAYTAYDDTIITATASVTNRGSGKAQNVDLDLNVGELQLRGGTNNQLHQHYDRIDAGTSQSFSVTLVVPEIMDQKSYTLNASVLGLDVKDFKYNATGTGYITILPKSVETEITISKAVKERIYYQDPAIVSITVGNDGVYELKNIHVTDSINENFKLQSNTSLQWDIPSLLPGENWGTTYSIIALDTSLNGFPIPAAIAQFTVNGQTYSVYSGTNTVVVYGPKFALEKTTDRQVVNVGEDVTVTDSINNRGNIATGAMLQDSLPEGVSLVNGITSFAFTALDLNSPGRISYIIRMNKAGAIKLPSFMVNYTSPGYNGMKREESSSESPVITVIDPGKITSGLTGTQAPTPVTPGVTITAPTIENKQESAPKNTIPSPTTAPERASIPAIQGFSIIFSIIILIIATLRIRKKL